ncbi:MlaD family protein [Conexibacter sp. SYSU D00693]|uniref:MlaD family protein n=1 Tax=Conexibacter sp. SYSU D00693 TaxID=2812560 RepID=UPI00196B96DC|nr:MlaD family protein [Conexibacter sp. SYSU D00693]
MRRLAGPLLLVVALAALWAALSGAGGEEREGRVRYTVELDNAFGLIEGADVKIAGVRAGRISKLRLDRSDMRALVDVEVDRKGFGDLRKDAFCQTRPQSLIGEYFVDCRPGTSAQRLPEGGLVPVSQTGSTIPVDLVNNIMRRPYRERMSIILGELGAGLAARGGDLNETIKRASPALRETDRVLAVLRRQRATIRDLYRDADTVLGELAEGREDVTRFVAEARDTARVGAGRPAALRRQLRALPRFLAEATQTMPLLEASADRQGKALTTLRSNATLLRGFLDRLGPFAEASRPAVRTLAAATQRGTPAVEALRPRLVELTKPARDLPELAQNAAIVLEHLDDRRFAVEQDPASPGGAGFTGLEALLRYVFNQSQGINLTDGRNYILKIALFLDAGCLFVKDADKAKAPANQRCAALLGPSRPGVSTPDPTKTATPAMRRGTAETPARDDAVAPRDTDTAAPVAPTTPSAPGAAPQAPAPEQPKGLIPGVQQLLDGLLGPGTDQRQPGLLPGLLGGGKAQGPSRQPSQRGTDALLDLLLGP